MQNLRPKDKSAMTYKLALNAEDDLERIWNYGAEHFGEKQADFYFEALFEKFQQIADSPYQYPIADQIKEGYRRCIHNSDTIYFRTMSDSIEIMAVIGRQDTTVWL